MYRERIAWAWKCLSNDTELVVTVTLYSALIFGDFVFLIEKS